METVAYRVSVWKRAKLPISQGGTLVSREFCSLQKAAKWLKRCDGECEVFEISKGEEVMLFSGSISTVYAAIRAEFEKHRLEAQVERLEAIRAEALDAAQVSCPACGKMVSRKADSCPNCGHPPHFQLQKLGRFTWWSDTRPWTARPHSSHSHSGWGLFGIIVLAVVAAIIILHLC